MKLKEILKKAENTEFELHKHNMGKRTITRWRYVKEEYTPFKYTFDRIQLGIQFKGEIGEYRINKSDYKKLEKLKK